jgi:hypothetical protein
MIESARYILKQSEFNGKTYFLGSMFLLGVKFCHQRSPASQGSRYVWFHKSLLSSVGVVNYEGNIIRTFEALSSMDCMSFHHLNNALLTLIPKSRTQ